MERPLRILFATSEMTPLLSTGGLAEVAGALPRALHAKGHDVRVAMPCYRQIPVRHRGDPYCLCRADLGNKVAHGAMRLSAVPDTPIPLYLIEHEGYFRRETPYGSGACEYEDNAERFCFFCLALMHALPQMHWKPDIIHCHDWHTAPMPIFIKTRFRDDPFWKAMPTLFTIHNLAYQGRYAAEKIASTGLGSELFCPECLEYEGDMNLMKGALVFADALSTVSPRYAREIQTMEYGAGLHGVLRTRREDLHGILNGVDYGVWNPETDAHIAAHYTAEDLRGKALCKSALQDLFNLPQADVPIIGIVSRLHWQKGLDLLASALNEVTQHDVQLVVLGSGDPDIENHFLTAAQRHPDKVSVYLGFDSIRSHAVQAGSDFLLMPSRYEPCGLGQLYALSYGTIPIARRTGGLVDTIRPYRPFLEDNKDATGILFAPLTHQAVTRSILQALCLYKNQNLLRQMRRNGMSERYSWDRSCQSYLELYRQTINKR